ncbi:hypothetical protein BO71DRAFT_133326 [Aspergillus ellipticus CBS 707.79]|uniref:Uncharacterized protein n=1 Tax=Aspergillus ellipticus CBS 707.79 TaxID=1448320 RepID=A0A319CV93_9EURO|nr:hypothetical protein BO71DRAFT_133326 [Aspergillus ellipticus CBS 707.79]
MGGPAGLPRSASGVSGVSPGRAGSSPVSPSRGGSKLGTLGPLGSARSSPASQQGAGGEYLRPSLSGTGPSSFRSKLPHPVGLINDGIPVRHPLAVASGPPGRSAAHFRLGLSPPACYPSTAQPACDPLELLGMAIRNECSEYDN